MLSTQPTAQGRSHVSAFDRIALWLPRSYLSESDAFGKYALHGGVYDQFHEAQIAVIVLLASDEECLHKTGCNLRTLYHKAGFQVLYLPIPDSGVPTTDDLEQAVQHTIAYAQAGHHTVIHCSAGIGRTAHVQGV